MRLTKKKAIESTRKRWERLAETGECDGEDCALCEYVVQEKGNCLDCPYFEGFNYCNSLGSNYNRWYKAKTVRTRKKYAIEVLEEVKKLK